MLQSPQASPTQTPYLTARRAFEEHRAPASIAMAPFRPAPSSWKDISRSVPALLTLLSYMSCTRPRADALGSVERTCCAAAGWAHLRETGQQCAAPARPAFVARCPVPCGAPSTFYVVFHLIVA